MDWTKQTQDFFQTWTDVQKKTWENWVDAMKSFDAAQPGQVWEKAVDAWHEAVKNTLTAQVEGSRVWTESVASIKGAPEQTAEWAQQIQENTKRWIDLQQQMWDNWFELMKKAAPSKFAAGWDKNGQNIVTAWQEMMTKAADAQTDWARQWVDEKKKAS